MGANVLPSRSEVEKSSGEGRELAYVLARSGVEGEWWQQRGKSCYRKLLPFSITKLLVLHSLPSAQDKHCSLVGSPPGYTY
ncbi:hypothetical protein VNO80_16299 [Phaseolus coccineus]|uniref:Uncharacterized protein n=1 Tax=Phaseolus coccineus TaxID=3886 RepID=A0AAN9R7U5_PHACN